MTETEIWETLTDIFRGFFGDDELVLTPATTARDVPGWDSIAHVQLMILVEQRFRLRFNTGETASFKSVGPMVELIVTRLASR